jgi:hypothetical protein
VKANDGGFSGRDAAMQSATTAISAAHAVVITFTRTFYTAQQPIIPPAHETRIFLSNVPSRSLN